MFYNIPLERSSTLKEVSDFFFLLDCSMYITEQYIDLKHMNIKKQYY